EQRDVDERLGEQGAGVREKSALEGLPVIRRDHYNASVDEVGDARIVEKRTQAVIQVFQRFLVPRLELPNPAFIRVRELVEPLRQQFGDCIQVRTIQDRIEERPRSQVGIMWRIQMYPDELRRAGSLVRDDPVRGRAQYQLRRVVNALQRTHPPKHVPEGNLEFVERRNRGESRRIADRTRTQSSPGSRREYCMERALEMIPACIRQCV